MNFFSQKYIIKDSDTAVKMSSGSLEVYATPAMIALMENTATKAITDLSEEFTTVGIEVDAQHLKACSVGEEISCSAELVNVTGKIYEFYIEALNAKGEKIGTATHKRAIVNKEDFMKRVFMK